MKRSQTAKKQGKPSLKVKRPQQTKTSPSAAPKQRQAAAGEVERYWMLCPRCGLGLIETVSGPIKVERCTACGRVWADRRDVERLSEQDALAVFKSIPGK